MQSAAVALLQQLEALHVQLERAVAHAQKDVVTSLHADRGSNSGGGGGGHAPLSSATAGAQPSWTDTHVSASPGGAPRGASPAVSKVLSRTKRDIIQLLHQERVAIGRFVHGLGVHQRDMPLMFQYTDPHSRPQHMHHGGHVSGVVSPASQLPATPVAGGSYPRGPAAGSNDGDSSSPEVELGILQKLREVFTDKLRACVQAVTEDWTDASVGSDSLDASTTADMIQAQNLVHDIAKYGKRRCFGEPGFLKYV